MAFKPFTKKNQPMITGPSPSHAKGFKSKRKGGKPVGGQGSMTTAQQAGTKPGAKPW
jgi:hypothetical protein